MAVYLSKKETNLKVYEDSAIKQISLTGCISSRNISRAKLRFKILDKETRAATFSRGT